ncbi:hypothetical protein [Pedobacter nyackensis]|uniref:hypothetical protein n=1 Tax=Pedobacter nyackensis TaxID=475255 RepID=UPI00292F39B9|nr:hypothetical protein [Pedobacter nyackensis]
MKKLIIAALACYGLSARAQMHESKNFLYLYSDSVIYAKKIMLRPDFAGYWQLRADSRRVPTEQVKFFNNEEGFFANTRKLHLGGLSSFSERIIDGRINVFQEMTYDPFFDNRGPRYMDRRQSRVDLRMYYNKGYGNLKKVNYNNLKNDMSDHAESMDLLKGYKKSMNTSKIMYTAAAVSVIAGIVSFLAADKKVDSSFPGHFGDRTSGMNTSFSDYTPSLIMFGLGLGFTAGGYVIQTSGSRHLERAVDAYNR